MIKLNIYSKIVIIIFIMNRISIIIIVFIMICYTCTSKNTDNIYLYR